jgi:hypothetical protein
MKLQTFLIFSPKEMQINDGKAVSGQLSAVSYQFQSS